MVNNAFIYAFMLRAGGQATQTPEDRDYFCAFKEPRSEAADDTNEVLVDMWRRSRGVRWHRRTLRPLALGDIIWCDGSAYMFVEPENATFTLQPSGLSVAAFSLNVERILSCRA